MASYVKRVELPAYPPGTRHNPIDFLCEQEKDDYMNNAIQKELRYGRGPYLINGVPISHQINGCCNKDPCFCRSDVIFYDGIPYDQKPFIEGGLRTRAGNVMYYEGKMAGPFNPGKSPLVYGPNKSRDRPPGRNCFETVKGGKGGYHYNRCCTTSIYGDKVPPYHNTHKLAYTKLGLPHGNTIGYFRFKPERVCYDRDPPVRRIEDCCDCPAIEYDASQYINDECPGKSCC